MTDTEATCAFAIAGLTLSLSADNAALIDRFRVRYQAYRVDTDNGLRVHFQIKPGTTGLAEYPIEFRDGALHFTHPRCTGCIDLAQGAAHLCLAVAAPDQAVEYVLRATTALLAFDAGGLMLHAAGLVRGDRGYAFFGHSGSGKTTVSRVSTEVRVLNDDLVVLMPNIDWQIHATPFSNPTQVPPAGPGRVPLAGLLRLVQSKQVRIQAMPVAQAAAEVLTSVPIVPLDPQRMPILLERVLNLVTAVPTSRLHFLPDDSFWQVI